MLPTFTLLKMTWMLFQNHNYDDDDVGLEAIYCRCDEACARTFCGTYSTGDDDFEHDSGVVHDSNHCNNGDAHPSWYHRIMIGAFSGRVC